MAGIRQHVARRLTPRAPDPSSSTASAASSWTPSPAKLPPTPLPADSTNAALEAIYTRPSSCLLIFPGVTARPLAELLDDQVRYLVFIDATWRFAKEMVAASEPLTALRCAVLEPPPGVKPNFVVRKPLLLAGSAGSFSGPAPPGSAPWCPGPTAAAAAAAGEAEDTEASRTDRTEEEPRWGFSTAEAVALAADEVQRLRATVAAPAGEASEAREAGEATGEATGGAWRAVSGAVGAYARLQLERTTAPRARPERPGYIPGLYEGLVQSSSNGHAPSCGMRGLASGERLAE